MARTKIRGVKLGEVSFVGKGDNKGAHILLVKEAKDIVALGKNYKGKDKSYLLQKWFESDASKIDGIFKEEEAMMFADLLADKKIRDQVWSMVWMLEDSICCIMNDESIKDKGELISTTVEQFKEAITSLTKNHEEEEEAPMEKTVEELEKEVADLTKENGDLKTQNEDLTKERDELKKSVPVEKTAQIDKSALSPELREYIETLEKSSSATAVAVTKLQDEAIAKECADIAKEIPSISAEGVDVVNTLKSLKKADPALFATVSALLKTADARINEGGLFLEKGKTDDPNAANGSAYDKLVAKAKELQKADPSLSFEKAFDKVYVVEHDLRKEYQAGR